MIKTTMVHQQETGVLRNANTVARNRRGFLKVAAATGVGACVSRQATAAEPVTLKMITSWPKASPGPGQTADRLAERIETLSSGRIKLKVYAAGELVSALEVFDAVQSGAADLGHSAVWHEWGQAVYGWQHRHGHGRVV